MESNEEKKKIVFKKGILAPKVISADEAAIREAEAAKEREREELAKQLQYSGEVFDQYYRPLSVQGGLERIIEIAKAPPVPQAPPRRLSREEREERGAKHQDLAEALAHQIFQLAQKQRESDIDLYLSACNVVVADRSPEESKEILDRANEFFTDHYYTPIRERGERPEISHQVIKRVGHQGEDRITRIVRGMDVESEAGQLWSIYNGPLADKDKRISDILLDCTERQLVAVRDEFLRIPYKSLAKQAHAILNYTQSDVKGTNLKKSIGKNEVTEQKRSLAFRARDDFRALRYLFLGRSVEEMKLVKRLYLELAGPDATEQEEGLEAHVNRAFSKTDRERLAPVLNGWSPHSEAEVIHEMLFPKTQYDPIEDTLSEPRDAVDRDHTQGIGPYLRYFKKRRMWAGKGSIYHRVLNCYEVLAERVDALSSERFAATNKALLEVYGYELNPAMFASRRLMDPRRVAMVIAERIEVSADLFDMVLPIHFRGPRDCLAVQQAFKILYGESLEDSIRRRLERLSSPLSEQARSALIDRYVNGGGRWSLSIDVLGRYRGVEPEPGVWQWEYKGRPEDDEVAVTLAQIMDQELEVGEFDRPVLDFLSGRDYDELNRIERAFFELTDPAIPLRIALRNCLSPEAFNLAEVMLSGVDLQGMVTGLHSNPESCIELSDLPPSIIRLIREGFERAHFVGLDQHLLDTYPHRDDEDLLIEMLSLVLSPEAFSAKDSLLKVSRSSVDQIDEVRALCRGPLPFVLSFERSFDTAFPRFRVHLKYAAARMALSAGVFAEIILRLEGVEPEVTSLLQEYFDAVDINLLLETLRRYQSEQKVIEECFDLLNPEAQLKSCIKEMKVDPDYINETLLHLDGYSSKDVAFEINEILESSGGSLKGHELGIAVLGVLAVPTPQRPNPRVPEDINWMDEMAYQILLSYHRDYGQDLIDRCRTRGLDSFQLEELTCRLFGMEATSLARELFGLIKANKAGEPHNLATEQRIFSFVESRGSRYRFRLVRAYNSFWAYHPGFESLLDDVANYIVDLGIRKKLHALLLAVGAEGKSRRPGTVIPIQ
jgi:hypothetical protein